MLNPKLKQLADTIKNKELRKKVLNFLEKPTFELNGKTYTGPSFDVCPGGITHHHTYRGGYIEHIMATQKIALALCDVTEEVYGGKVDRDLVTAGVLLHDVYKPITYMVDENGNFVSAPITDAMDHISLATSELVRRDFPPRAGAYCCFPLRKLRTSQTANYRSFDSASGRQHRFAAKRANAQRRRLPHPKSHRRTTAKPKLEGSIRDCPFEGNRRLAGRGNSCGENFAGTETTETLIPCPRKCKR